MPARRVGSSVDTPADRGAVSGRSAARLVPALLPAAALLFASLPATAADPAPAVAPISEPDAPADPSGWRFQATFYGWLSGLDGTMGVRNRTAAVDLSPMDVIEDLDGALMAALLARHENWIVAADLMAAKTSSDDSFGNGRIYSGVDFTQITVSGLAGYRLPVGTPGEFDLNGTVGFRYQHLKGNLTLTATQREVSFGRTGTEQWIDPTVGMLLQYQINEKWFVNALADIGGFGVGSDLTAQGLLTVGYMWTPQLSTSIGYRAIYTDYRNDGFVYDVTQHGVLVGLGYHF